MKKQLDLNLSNRKHGGRRSGTGRKRRHSPGIAHRTREIVHGRFALHVNFKLRLHIRSKETLKILKRAILNARAKGLGVVHFSLQSNHVHLIVEAQNNEILTRGMRSLTITVAKGIKKGRVQIERYHLHILKTLRETKNAVRYVLLNEQKHTKSKRIVTLPYCSLVFLGHAFSRRMAKREKLSLIWRPPEEKSFLDKAKSWILRTSLATF
jgi:hypothetical protein